MGWDRQLDYEETYRLILDHLRRARRDTQRAYDIILLIQLKNGSRISEAIDFAKQLCLDFDREKRVRVRKRRDDAERLMVLPREVKKKELQRLCYVVMRADKGRLASYCRRTYGFNTHSLRYAFISHLAKKGVAPQLIAKITGHKRLDYVLHYTQRVKAEDLLRSLNA